MNLHGASSVCEPGGMNELSNMQSKLPRTILTGKIGLSQKINMELTEGPGKLFPGKNTIQLYFM